MSENTVHDDIMEALMDYRRSHLRRGPSVPEHEIVISPPRHCDLMRLRISRRFMDYTKPFRNYAGARLVIDPDAGPHVSVRDRTGLSQ